jgi:ribulose-bisphosphate carboxylase large chain
MVHPALMGSFFYRDQGISHRVLLGDLMRLIGADLVIYPNFGGRFPFKEDDCRQISHALKCDMYGFKKSFPVPAGGINMEVLPKLRDFYGEDVVFLIGSNLYTYSKSLSDSVKYFFERLEG